MKKLNLAFLASTFASLSVFAGDLPKIEDYRNSTWELKEEDAVFRYRFDEKDAIYTVFSCDGDKCKKRKMRFKDVEIYPPISRDGIHGNKPVFGGVMNGKKVVGFLYIDDEDQNCLLLPDTEAPEDCLRKK